MITPIILSRGDKNYIRSMNRSQWKHYSRLMRCIHRAVWEHMEKHLSDIVIFGSSITTPEESTSIHNRTLELLEGLKPTKGEL